MPSMAAVAAGGDGVGNGDEVELPGMDEGKAAGDLATALNGSEQDSLHRWHGAASWLVVVRWGIEVLWDRGARMATGSVWR
jgi:hypothetical protein